jgi:hypothetical protein
MVLGLLGSVFGLMIVGQVAKQGMKTTETLFKMPGKCIGKC